MLIRNFVYTSDPSPATISRTRAHNTVMIDNKEMTDLKTVFSMHDDAEIENKQMGFKRNEDVLMHNIPATAAF